MAKIKQLKELEEQKGLSDETITEILTNKDVNQAYKILMQSAILFYHLQGDGVFQTEAEYFQAFPFTVHYADAGTVAGQLLKEYDTNKKIWNLD